MKIVFSVGGSVIAPDDVDKEFMGKLASFLAELAQTNQLVVVVGGGAPARREISKARQQGTSEAECDHVGIQVTRENARALAKQLGNGVNNQIPSSIAEAVVIVGKRILVMGGTEPGHSTDAVAALIADWVNADLLINATNVNGIYDKDPNENTDATLRETIRIEELLDLVKELPIDAGGYALLDLTAAKVIQRSKIKTICLNGRNIENMRDAIEGRPFEGTTVLS